MGNEQTWRMYAPEGKDTTYDTKMNLRNMVRFAPFMGRGEVVIVPNLVDDYADDRYTMDIGKEEVMVVARENGQKTQTLGVFDDLNAGIFFNASEKNYREAEGKLAKIFV